MGEALTKSIRHEKCGRSVERRPCMTPLGVEHQSYACVLAYSVSPRIAMTPLGVEHLYVDNLRGLFATANRHDAAGRTRHGFPKAAPPRRISSRKSQSSAAAKRFLAMLNLAG